ncbi:hypothetical protein [Cohnella sp. WQ 127256]|uniref:hypothetical protein n=1 Tax=Cohnella sp. WQ 127256 TaxID=2938790 RepID=UPI0021196788|nr:hypothetical protein [Cohnella sp. WQ 127256]
MNTNIYFENLYDDVKGLLKIVRQQTANGQGLEEWFFQDMAFDGIEYVKHCIPQSDEFRLEAIKCLEEIRDRLVTESEDRLYTH